MSTLKKNTSIYVSLSSDGPIAIHPYKILTATVSPHCDTLWSDDVTVKSYDVPKPEEPVMWDEKIEEVESPASEDPINIEDWDLLYLERGKLKEEFKETY